MGSSYTVQLAQFPEREEFSYCFYFEVEEFSYSLVSVINKI